ncbi:MAG: rhomboid family intramembrane serine protease [Hoeflea sp.]|uniref:rhomboid family intramembrane serine protease n=1 Tax=Hoeflea sp. TaxID=1940281 RepID=UPI001E0AF8A3|nr:rhomboid family intramembrane serine protease [Hoeflea sp.]MBU4530650.1 rhomboid family intramembrane serine protease [Alphaproteobacteria bacterium]MBU4544870.1 rhomboid family intramembrane serine protease [Alphaproteobacteria bacterium]MBU4552013.1 rhomboid family intramembrane serine protease [Alphaproteobacteria bacterium]MBV1722202.1 rhomboid family intramembrane serine protease [Hoeflea sp.]MBV1761764.1 rhomboid family intramembrane serine protease [Hoeflea sp.]
MTHEPDRQDPDPRYAEPDRPGHEPIFNIPNVVLAILLVMVAIQVALDSFLPERAVLEIILQGAFIPQRYSVLISGQVGPYLWSPFTYSLLHGGYAHLALNSFWLAAFGSIIARRIGWVRFLVFWFAGAIASAALFLVFHWGDQSVMVGASGVVSALMGAAARFAFGNSGFRRDRAHLNPRTSIVHSLSNRTVVAFLAVWFGINLLTAVGFSFGMVDSAIAWEAHVGGFLFGFLAFSLFDPIDRR